MKVGDLARVLATAPEAGTHAAALAQFEALKESEDGWVQCLTAVTDNTLRSEEELFICLQVVEAFVKTRYAQAPHPQAQEQLKALLRHWILLVSQAKTLPRVYLRNKMSYIAALIFVADFPQRWATFFSEVFGGDVLTSPEVVDFYLRTLLAIDSEVADKDVTRSREEMARNTIVKDAMRDSCVTDITASWFTILSGWLNGQSSGAAVDLGSLCLAALAAYVVWIDIGLIANDRFVPLIVQALGRDETSESAADALCSIMGKGMEPETKLELVSALHAVLDSAAFFTVGPETEEEQCVRVGTVLDSMATELMEAYNKCDKRGSEGVKTALLAALQARLPLLITVFGHPELEVSQTVVESLHAYLIFIKSNKVFNEEQKARLKELGAVAMEKYRFPEDYNHEKEGEDEAVFLEYRKDVRNILVNIGMLVCRPPSLPPINLIVVVVFEDKETVLCGVEELMERVGSDWQSLRPSQINLALSLLYSLADIFPANTGALFASPDPLAARLKSLLRKMVESGVSGNGHSAVVLEYLETIVRYDKFFGTQPDLLPAIVTSMLDKRGLHHESPKVRTRAAYLFSRFVKLQKTGLAQYVGEILGQLGDLLVTSPKSAALMSSEDQLFLYEATAGLIVVGNFTPQEKAEYMKSLLGSLVARFKEGAATLAHLATPEEKVPVLQNMKDVIAFASRTTKAFSPEVTMKSCLCSDIFVELMGTFLAAIEVEQGALLDSFRQYLHRMVMCLDDDLLDKLPLLLNRFIAVAPDLKSLQDFLGLLNQIVTKFKEASVGPLSGEMRSVLVHVSGLLGEADPRLKDDTARDLLYVRRAFLQLITTALTNNVAGALIMEEGLVERVMMVIEETTVRCTDPLAIRQALSLATKIAEATPQYPTLVPVIWPWAMERMVRAGFQLPIHHPEFQFLDAQETHIINELASSLIAFAKLREDFVGALGGELITGLGYPQAGAQELARSVQTHANQPKTLQKHLKTFLLNHRKAASALT